jgi:hypothetical protein
MPLNDRWRRFERRFRSGKAGRSVGPALVGCLHLGLHLESTRSIARNYAGPRGEGSTPVPLPPPTLSDLRFLHGREGRNSLNKVGPLKTRLYLRVLSYAICCLETAFFSRASYFVNLV